MSAFNLSSCKKWPIGESDFAISMEGGGGLEALFIMRLRVLLFTCPGANLGLSNVSFWMNRTKANEPKEETGHHCLVLISYKAASSSGFWRQFPGSSSKQ